MSPDEFEAVAQRIEARADAREQEGASEQHEAEGMRIAVAMFREALAKSDACAGCGHAKHPPLKCAHGWERYSPHGEHEAEPGSGCHCLVGDKVTP